MCRCSFTARSPIPRWIVFDRERVFIDTVLAPIVRRFPGLRIVFEHVTTREAAEFVRGAGPNVAATITAHHLLYNRNAIFAGGIRPHHYCLPVLKREAHRAALVHAATGGSPKFFLGTDSAPHRAPRQGGGVRPARASTPRMRRSSSTRRPSTRPARSTGSRRSRAFTARISTACRATPGG